MWMDVSGQLTRANIYGIANVYYEFRDGTLVNVADTTFANANERLWRGIGAGGSYNWANECYALFGEALLKTGLDHVGYSYSVGGTIGFRARW
jgi:fibronectin-binding autotransporter adhesin